MVAPAEPRTGRSGPVRLQVFGLEVSTVRAFEGSCRRLGEGRGPSAVIRWVEPQVLEDAWTGEGASLLWERRQPSGGTSVEIAHHPERGYRVAALGHGSYVVSGDGRQVLAWAPPDSRWRWQRLLLAEVLPLASALQGFGLLHASAVAMGGYGYGFVARAGGGKTSLAAHLLTQGAAFITDDVLALAGDADGVRAHPGPGLLALEPAELRSIELERRPGLGRLLGRNGKTYLARSPVEGPVPLAALYFLERSSQASHFSVTSRPPEARHLLSTAFLRYLQAEVHLRAHLEVCAWIAESVPLYTVRIPLGVSARQVATRIAAHAAFRRAGWSA